MDLTNDNYWVAPDASTIETHAERWQCTAHVAAERLLFERERWIAAVRADPYRMGFEPSIWWVAWSLLDWPWVQASTVKHLAGRLGVAVDAAWGEWKRRIRRKLGFGAAVRDLLIMGAIRSSKTDFAAKTTQQFATNTKESMALFLAQQYALSALTVQPRLWHYMPAEWKIKHMGSDWYVHYKDLKGFSEAQYQLPSGTKVIGKFYSQDPKEALVGSEAAWGWADEEIPIHWMDETGRRLASKRGKLLLTFTPMSGYTPVVKSFLDGASIVKTTTAYMLPRDGGPTLPWRAIGLTRDEWERRRAEISRGAVATVPASRPEDCVAWLEDKPPAPDAETAGRAFEEAPRVARCFDPARAVLWFETSDNPYGEPMELMDREGDKDAERVRTVLYGIAVKSRAAVFANYNELVHVIPDDAVPAQGVNYCFNDPAGTRNDALLWIRSTPEADYVYREWPGSYHIPGIGVPGPWAKVSGRNKGWNDGDRDEGTESFGFGFCRMKFEIARLEGWKDYLEWAAGMNPQDLADGAGLPDEETIMEWDEAHGAREVITARFMDSRPAGSTRTQNDGETTLLEQWNRLGGWDWNTAPGDSIREGTGMIVDALEYVRTREGKLERPPQQYIAESCRNVRFALASYTGQDGLKGAVKDWIDMLRYFYQLGLALCRGADPLLIASIFGRQTRGAAIERQVWRATAGGALRRSVIVERNSGDGIDEVGPGTGRRIPREIAAAGLRRTGGRGARMVWRRGR